MRSGKLRRRITIESASEAQDTFGEADKTWSSYAVVWASVETLQGKEYFSAQAIHADLQYRFRLRYSATTAAITPKMRVSWNSRTFDIHSIRSIDERNREIHIMAMETT